MLENEILKISNYNKINISIEDISKLSSNMGMLQLEDLFFQCIDSSNQLIIRKSRKTIRSSADAYSFLKIAKNFLKILIYSSENKNKKVLLS